MSESTVKTQPDSVDMMTYFILLAFRLTRNAPLGGRGPGPFSDYSKARRKRRPRV